MKIYQVGGAVRDMLLNKKPHDFDYLVVGSTVEEMLAKGFQQVGIGFPVFLHPETKEEYALARKEIKTGNKHTDFEFIFSSDVTLEEDVQRRDFTINALARNPENGEIIDLVNGKNDLQKRIIRHINSEHFIEDPLRVLRMCRFAAQLNFDIAPETMELAKKMVAAKMLDHLFAERIWQEIKKALQTQHFEKFIITAKECGALQFILPEVEQLWQTPEKIQYHPEGNSGAHTILTLQQAQNLSEKVKFALLLHDIGKTQTPDNILPAHHNHEENGLPLIEKICSRLKIPNEYRNFALLCCEQHMRFRLLPQMKIGKAFDLVQIISKNFKDENQMSDFIEVCRCDSNGRAKDIAPEENEEFDKAVHICFDIFNKAKDIRATDMPDFHNLKKDENFKKLYRDFVISQIR